MLLGPVTVHINELCTSTGNRRGMLRFKGAPLCTLTLWQQHKMYRTAVAEEPAETGRFRALRFGVKKIAVPGMFQYTKQALRLKMYKGSLSSQTFLLRFCNVGIASDLWHWAGQQSCRWLGWSQWWAKSLIQPSQSLNHLEISEEFTRIYLGIWFLISFSLVSLFTLAVQMQSLCGQFWCLGIHLHQGCPRWIRDVWTDAAAGQTAGSDWSDVRRDPGGTQEGQFDAKRRFKDVQFVFVCFYEWHVRSMCSFALACLHFCLVGF